MYELSVRYYWFIIINYILHNLFRLEMNLSMDIEDNEIIAS